MGKPKAQKTYQMEMNGEVWERRAIKMTISLYPRDQELLSQLTEFLGTNQSDAIRTAIRLAVAQLVNAPVKAGSEKRRRE